MIRVLHVVGTMDLGGAETFIMNLYRNIDRDKIQFDFLCHNRIEAKYTEEIRAMGGKMYMVHGISHVGFFRYQKQLYKFFKEHPEYNIVHSHQNLLNGLILKQAAKAGVKKRISHLHTVYHYNDLLKKAMLLLFKQYINKYTTDAIACSIPAGEGLYSGNLLKSFEVINNGIDTKKFTFNKDIRNEIRQDLSLGDGPVLGHVGRFAPVKNHTLIIDVFAEFLKSYPNAKLLLIGEGELLESVKKKTVALGIDKSILLLGSRTDVNSLMNAMDIFIFPSVREGLPVSVVEAQSIGLKVVTSNTISEDTVITDLISRVSLAASTKEWSEHICSVYENIQSIDRNQYSKKVEKAGFDATMVAQHLINKYLKS